MSSVATSNNESTNESMTPAASSTEGNSSISTLTADTTAWRINRGEAEDGGDVDFVEAGRGGGFDEDLVGGEESGAEESGEGEEHSSLLEEELPPLQSIFDCAYIVVRVVNDGKEGWECRCCNQFLPPNMPRARSAMSINFGRVIL